jgi:hypothetical protein
MSKSISCENNNHLPNYDELQQYDNQDRKIMTLLQQKEQGGRHCRLMMGTRSRKAEIIYQNRGYLSKRMAVQRKAL